MEVHIPRVSVARPVILATTLLLVAMLILPACSGTDDPDETPTPSATATSPAAAATETTPAEATATLPATEPAPTEPPATATTPPEPTATTASPTEPAPTATTAVEEMVLSVYFVRDEHIATAHRTVPYTQQQVAAAAMEELLGGPNAEEAAVGMVTAIPEGVEYLGTTIDQGVATVDLSGEFESGGGTFSMAMRLGQVVYTLTQFPTIDFVNFKLDGEPVEIFSGEGIVLDRPVSRKDFEDLTPIIFVASPAVNDVVSSPMRVHGTANTFEAAFMLQIRDAEGNIIVEQPMMATSGTGTRGTFDANIEFDAPPGSQITLRVFEHSAKDGSEVNVVEIPLVVGP